MESLEDLFLKTLCFLFNFQEAIQENSVTMNKMRLLKTKMESQKNLKVCWIPEETFFSLELWGACTFPLLHATLSRPLVLVCMCFLLQTSCTMLLHDSGCYSGFMWKVINSHLSSTNISLQWPLHLPHQILLVENRKTLNWPLTWTNTHFSWISPHFSVSFTQINLNSDNSNSH